MVYVVVEKNGPITERFFDKHYKANRHRDHMEEEEADYR
jgi:hypothetical protein